MKKRLLAMLLVLAMALSLMPPITVSAASGADYREDYAQVIADANAMTFPENGVSPMTAYCPACGAEDAVWQPLTAEGSYTNGHYYLAKDIVGDSADGLVLLSGSAGTLCLHLNKHTLNDTGRTWPAIRMWSGNCHLNLMGEGTVTCNSGNWGALSCQGGTCNVYGGTFSNTGTNYDGAINCRNNTINIYNGEITEGKLRLSSYTGTDFPTVNVYGGTFPEVRGVNSSAKLTVKGGNITTLNGGCDVTVAGGTVGTVCTNGLQDYTTFSGKITVTGGTINTLVVDEYATGFEISGNPVINALNMSTSQVLPTVGTLTEGAKINIGSTAGVFTTPFASEEAAKAAIDYFVSNETIAVTEDNCLTAGANAYLVGYSKVDINPYAEDGTIMPLPMAGHGNNDNRLALAEKLDDDGDGDVDANDGIFATCTAITDQNGKTVLMYTLDLLWGYNDNYGPEVMDTLLNGEEFKQYNLTEDCIFFNGSHNHFAPEMAEDSKSDNAARFNDILYTQLIEAAKEALLDRANAYMYQGSMDIVDYFNADNGANKEQSVCDLLNEMRKANRSSDIDIDESKDTYAKLVGDLDVLFTASRHYKITEQKILQNADGSPMVDLDGSPYLYVLDPDAEPVTYYAGNGFNEDWKGVNFLHTVYEYDKATAQVTDKVKEYRVITHWEETVKADDTLRVVEFRFEDSDIKPVAMINWRGHLPSSTSVLGTDENGNKIGFNTVSGGMVNALRNAMLFKGYRAAFLQGETGGINMTNKSTQSGWAEHAHTREQVNIFGTELAQLALTVINNEDKMTKADGGEIQALRQVYQTDYQHSNVFEYIAAARYSAEYAAEGDIGLRIYHKETLYYYVDANGDMIVDSKGYPVLSDDTDGTRVYSDKHVRISSIDEANRMNTNYKHKDNVGEYYNEVTLNALTIGEDFKLVSVAAEIFDHYGDEGTNLWDAFKADHKVGDNEPFILGVTNNSPGGGYMPDKTNYDLKADPEEITYVVGTYESNGTRYAKGTGEAVVEQLDIMLDFLTEDHTAVATTEGKCQHCGEAATWSDLTQVVAESRLPFERTFASGHYYLSGETDLTGISVPEGAEVCIDLCGQKLNVYRNIVIDNGGKLNMIDSQSTGTVMGYEALKNGGIFTVSEGAELNIYGGTYRYDEASRRPASGGIVCVSGEFTLYDGTLEGTGVSLAGGAMLVNSSGHAYFRGGKVTSGYITTGSANGICVTTYGEVTLSGDVTIPNLFYIQAASHTDTQRLHLDGVFTGNVTGDGQITGEVGIASDTADTTLGELNFTYSRRPQIIDGKVVMAANTDYVAQNAETGEFIYGDYTAEANTVDETKLLNTVLQTLPDGSRVVMMKNTTASFSVQQNLQWELKGFTLNSAITVAEGKSIQFTDCKGTGKVALAKVNGKITYAPASEDGKTVYVPIPGTDGLATLQEARINIDQMVLRAEAQDEETGKATPGLYFKHRFDGDETVKAQVEYYGIAFSLVGEPTAADLQAEGTLVYEDSVVYRAGDVVYTKLDGTGFGQKNAEATSTVITGIMKEGNGVDTNKRNAAMAIYGTAYVKLKDGTFILGENRVRSLQQQVEEVDEKLWNQLTHGQRRTMLRMYKNSAFTSVINKWETPNLKDPTKSQTTEEQDTLRILAIGNSHTVDATNLLYQVFEDQKTEKGMYETEQGTYKTVMIGNMYYSGCTVWNHVNFARQDAPVYQYYTYSAEGNSVTKETTLEEALHDQIWDIIILHEMNGSAAVESTYTGAKQLDLQRHINYVKANSLNGDPKLIWNFSWANPTSQTLWDLGYPKGDTYNWVEDYKAEFGPDLETMYDNMLEAMKANTKKYVMTNPAFSGTNVIPTGLATQYARNELGQTDDVLYRDYTHVSDFGRLMTSYLWFASIAGKTEIDVGIDKVEAKFREEKSRPLGDLEVTEDMQSIIEQSVKYAISQKGTLLPE